MTVRVQRYCPAVVDCGEDCQVPVGAVVADVPTWYVTAVETMPRPASPCGPCPPVAPCAATEYMVVGLPLV